MPRFFVESEFLQQSFTVLQGDAAAHAKVLRLKCGDEVTLCCGDGKDHIFAVSDVSGGQISLVRRREIASVTEPTLRCSVYMALAKADKFEHVVQKSTELGADEIVAFCCARCVSRPDERSLAKKLERWQKIAASAAEQCGRGKIPQVRYIATFADAIKDAAKAELPVLLYENEEKRSLRQAAAVPFASAALLTGPEGGFEQSEVAAARNAGLQICTLGPRILRCETAPLAALSALMFAAGEMDELPKKDDGDV